MATGGAATPKRVALTSRQQGRRHTFTLVLCPPNRALRAGVSLLLSTRPHRSTDPQRVRRFGSWPAELVIERGDGIAALQAEDIAPDDRDPLTRGVIELFEGAQPRRRADAWSYAASRAMDCFETDAEGDARRVAVVAGHAHGGKAALWAGAEDERFALTVSNESGCGGAALSRRPVGEAVELVTDSFPHWFADACRRDSRAEDTRPVDQHQLIALRAPRAVAVGSASADEWSDPEGEARGLADTSPAWALLGAAPVDPAG